MYKVTTQSFKNWNKLTKQISCLTVFVCYSKKGTFVLQILFLIMDLFIQISQFILSLVVANCLHELGHFIPAKLFKTRVEKFYLFFDVKYALFKKKMERLFMELGGYHWEVMSRFQA